jgi:hypothetical protein
MGYPDNGGFAVAAYTITAVIVLSYWVSLLRRIGKLK